MSLHMPPVQCCRRSATAACTALLLLAVLLALAAPAHSGAAMQPLSALAPHNARGLLGELLDLDADLAAASEEAKPLQATAVIGDEPGGSQLGSASAAGDQMAGEGLSAAAGASLGNKQLNSDLVDSPGCSLSGDQSSGMVRQPPRR